MPNLCACAARRWKRSERKRRPRGTRWKRSEIGRWRTQSPSKPHHPCALFPTTILSSLSGTLPADLRPAPGTPGPRSPNYRSRRCNSGALSVNSGRIDGAWRPLSQTPQFPPSPDRAPSPLGAPARVYISCIYRSSRRFPLAFALELMLRGNGNERICDGRESSLDTFKMKRSYACLFLGKISFSSL